MKAIVLCGITGFLIGIAFVLAYTARIEPLPALTAGFAVAFWGIGGLAVGVQWSQP